jgi:hypothetical protein
VPDTTENRPGTYVFHDAGGIANGLARYVATGDGKAELGEKVSASPRAARCADPSRDSEKKVPS